MKYTIAGSIEDALTHLALVGAAAIVEEATGDVAWLWWEDGPEPAATLEIPDDHELGRLVSRHAARHAEAADWVQAKHDHIGAPTGTMSPRVKAPKDTSTWDCLMQARRRILDAPNATWLDQAMWGALGEPGFWLEDQPDLGASRWEMKTRNRGEEFIGNRLAPLAREVGTWGSADVTHSLTGGRVLDAIAKGAPDSRSATGLRAPGPADNALVWCALWGIAATAVVPQSRVMSQTSGSWPRNRVHPRFMALPVFARPTTLARWKGVLASRAFDMCAFAHSPEQSDAAWLREAGAVGVALFPTEVAGSSSAPERRLLRGSLQLLA